MDLRTCDLLYRGGPSQQTSAELRDGLTEITPGSPLGHPAISLRAQARRQSPPGRNRRWRTSRRHRYASGVELVVERIPATASYPLRQAVLRPHQSIEAVVWEGDDEPRTATFGALDARSGAIVGVGTVFPEAAPFPPEAVGLSPETGLEGAAWRLRGMATRADLRGEGIGSSVLRAVVDHVSSQGGLLIWCNARVGAVGFYERAGFATFGDEWVLASIGPHVVMWRQLEPERA